MPYSKPLPALSSRSWYIAWCARWKPPTPKCTTPPSTCVRSYSGPGTVPGVNGTEWTLLREQRDVVATAGGGVRGMTQGGADRLDGRRLDGCGTDRGEDRPVDGALGDRAGGDAGTGGGGQRGEDR